MTAIQDLMEAKGWKLRPLAQKLGATRYLLRHLTQHEPETRAQRRLADRVVAFLQSADGGHALRGAPAETRLAPPAPPGIPLFGEIPAGPASLFDADVEPEGYVSLADLDPQRHFAVRVHGGSMEPDYRDDDIVICRRVEDVAMPTKEEGPTPFERFARFEGRVVCALLDGTETTLKRLELAKTGRDADAYIVNLRPFNPNYPVISIGPRNTLAIQGEVVRIVRSV